MKLITIKELSKLLSVKTSNLYSWVCNGKVPSCKLNGAVRFDPVEIEQWIEASKISISSARTLEKKPTKTQDIDAIVNKAIAEHQPKGYNLSKRKTSPKLGSQGRRI